MGRGKRRCRRPSVISSPQPPSDRPKRSRQDEGGLCGGERECGHITVLLFPVLKTSAPMMYHNPCSNYIYIERVLEEYDDII